MMVFNVSRMTVFSVPGMMVFLFLRLHSILSF